MTLDDLRFDLRLVLRRIVRQPGYALTVIVVLALGIGANSAVYGFVEALLLRPLPFPQADRLVRIESRRAGESGHLSAQDVRDLRERSQLLAGMASFRATQYTLTGDGHPEALAAVMASHDLFDVLGVRPLLGATWPAADDGTRQFKVVLSHRAWLRLGADPSIINRAITLDAAGYTVIGVMPPGFEFPAQVDLYRRVPGQDFTSRDIRSARAVARLKPGVTLAQLNQELEAISRRLADEFPATNRALQFRAAELRTQWIGDARAFLLLLSGAVGFVLLLACANAVNLILAQSLRREREMAVRVALGGSRSSIIRTLVIELAVFGIAGTIAGLGAGWFSTRSLDLLIRAERPAAMAVGINPRMIVATVLVSLVAVLLAGLLPVLQLSRATVAVRLRNDRRSGTSRSGRALRRRLAATQVTLAMILLAGASLFSRSLIGLLDRALGLDPDGVLTLQIDPPWSKFNIAQHTAPFYQRILDEIHALPVAEQAAIVEPLPFSGSTAASGAHRNLPVVEGRSADELERVPFVNLLMVSPEYLAAMRIRLIEGRNFDERDRLNAPPVALVSRTLAQTFWPGQPALGKRLRLGQMDANYRPGINPDSLDPGWFTVVGVAGDVQQGSGPGLDLYVSTQQVFAPGAFVAVRTRGRPERALAAVQQAIWRVDATQAVFDVRTMRGRLNDLVWQRRLATTLLGGFALLALVLAALGVYAITAFAVSERTSEIGVRMSVGAQRTDIARLILVEALRLLVISAALGLAAALALGRVAATLLHGVSPADPISLGGAAALLAGVVIAASWLPARRAARLDPIMALRAE